MTVVLDDVPLMFFEQASAPVVSYVKQKAPLRFWSVSRVPDGQVPLKVGNDAYGKVAATSQPPRPDQLLDIGVPLSRDDVGAG